MYTTSHHDEKEAEVIVTDKELSSASDDPGKVTHTAWGAIRRYRDGAMVAYESGDSPSKARSEEAWSSPTSQHSNDTELEKVVGALVSLVTVSVLLFIGINFFIAVLAVAVAFVVSSTGTGWITDRRRSSVNVVSPEEGSVLEQLLQRCCTTDKTTVQFGAVQILEAAAQCLLRRSEPEAEGLESLVDELIFVWEQSGQMSNDDEVRDTRQDLLEVATDLPSTAGAVGEVRASLHELSASIAEEILAAEQVRSEIDQPAIQAAMQDEELKVALDRQRTKIVSDRLLGASDRVRRETEISQAVAKQMREHDDREG